MTGLYPRLRLFFFFLLKRGFANLESCKLWTRMAWNYNPPNLKLPSSYYYSLAPQVHCSCPHFKYVKINMLNTTFKSGASSIFQNKYSLQTSFLPLVSMQFRESLLSLSQSTLYLCNVDLIFTTI
jgi:hypothetical protein